jgi:hypothetical protein
MTALGKLEGLCGRMILVFHLIEDPHSSIVSQAVARRAIRFIMSYVVPALRFTLNEGSESRLFDHWLADHVIHLCDTGTITMSDIKRSARRRLEGRSTWDGDQIVLRSMHDLEKAQWVIRLDDGSRENQHFAEWAINAKLGTMYAEHRKKVNDARERARTSFSFKQPDLS